MNWYRKHLNMTLLGGWLSVIVIGNVVSALIVSSEGALIALAILMVLIVYSLWWWVLSCKGRSHWWMALLGLGFLITFGLSNRRSGRDD